MTHKKTPEVIKDTDLDAADVAGGMHDVIVSSVDRVDMAVKPELTKGTDGIRATNIRAHLSGAKKR